MATNVGGYLCTSFVVDSGHVVRNPLSMVLHIVGSDRFPSAACRIAICCTMAALGMTWAATVVMLGCCVDVNFVLGGGLLTFHSGFVGILVPWNTTFYLL